MSWDIVLFNSKQKINLVAELKDNHIEVIGTDFTIEFSSEKKRAFV